MLEPKYFARVDSGSTFNMCTNIQPLESTVRRLAITTVYNGEVAPSGMLRSMGWPYDQVIVKSDVPFLWPLSLRQVEILRSEIRAVCDDLILVSIMPLSSYTTDDGPYLTIPASKEFLAANHPPYRPVDPNTYR